MSRRPLDGSARVPRLWRSVTPALVLGLGLFGACFDSDEKAVPLSLPEGTTGPVLPGTSSSSEGGVSSSSGEAEVTCRDAIACVLGCATELQVSMLPEPDLTCFLECEPGMTVDELLDLFRLTECVTLYCIELGQCDILVPTETSTTSGDGGDMTTTGTDTGAGSTGDRFSCVNCVFGAVSDPNPPGCQEFADDCE